MFSRILYPKPLRDEIRQILAAAKLNVVDLAPRHVLFRHLLGIAVEVASDDIELRID